MGVLIAMAVALTGALLPPKASALTQQWNCGRIAVNQWCQNTDNHSWAYSRAYWNGTAVPMCAKIINYSNDHNGTWNCATGAYVWSVLQASSIGPNTYAMVANGNSGTSKTITGWATTDY